MSGTGTAVSDGDLARTIVDLEAEIELLAAERKQALTELLMRNQSGIAKQYTGAGKEHGKVTLRTKDFNIEVDTRQTVKWDQDKLSAAGDAMLPEEAQHIIDVELSVSEKTYNALPPGDVKKMLTDARTTKLSAPSIKVVFPTGDKK